MGLRDREWFNEARNAPRKPQKQAEKPKLTRTPKTPSWALVGVAVVIAIAVIIWL